MIFQRSTFMCPGRMERSQREKPVNVVQKHTSFHTWKLFVFKHAITASGLTTWPYSQKSFKSAATSGWGIAFPLEEPRLFSTHMALDVGCFGQQGVCAWWCIVLSLCQGCNQPTAGFQGHWHLVASASNTKTKMGKLFRKQKKIIAALRSEKLDNNKISKCGKCSIQDKVISHSDHSVSRAPCRTTVRKKGWIKMSHTVDPMFQKKSANSMKRPGQNGTAQIGAVKAIDMIDTLFAQFHVFNIFQQKNIKEQFKQVTRWETKTTPRCTKMIQDVYDIYIWCFFGISSYHFEMVHSVSMFFYSSISKLALENRFFFGQPAPGWRWMTRHFHSVEKSIGVNHLVAIQFLLKFLVDFSFDKPSGFFRWWIHMKAWENHPSFCPAMGHVGLSCLMYCSDQAFAWPLSMSNHSRRFREKHGFCFWKRREVSMGEETRNTKKCSEIMI